MWELLQLYRKIDVKNLIFLKQFLMAYSFEVTLVKKITFHGCPVRRKFKGLSYLKMKLIKIQCDCIYEKCCNFIFKNRRNFYLLNYFKVASVSL